MVFEFKLPDIGEGVHEGEIVKWLVKEGDAVKEDQPIVEVMTDKATVELTAPRAGRIGALKAKEGEVIKVGTVFVTIEEGAGNGAKASAAKEETPAAGAKEEKQEKTLFEGQPSVDMIKRRRRESGREGQARAPAAVGHPAGRPIAAPALRRRAREEGIDLGRVKGTGPAGRITGADLESFLSQSEGPAASSPPTPTVAAAPQAAPAAPQSSRFKPGTTIPWRGLRRKIAEGMRKSKDTAAHFTYVEEVDATELVNLVESSRPLAERRGIKMTFLPFIVKAAVAALKAHPVVNARQEGGPDGDVKLLGEYHIGVAVATDNGLIVPVVKDADRKSVFQIAQEIAELSDKTRRGKASVAELTGSTFTITSLGKIGGVLATPIINSPEVAIMGVHAIKEKPVVRSGQVVVGKVMNLSFSFDHRIVDGYEGAEFAQTLIKFLADPKLLILETA